MFDPHATGARVNLTESERARLQEASQREWCHVVEWTHPGQTTQPNRLYFRSAADKADFIRTFRAVGCTITRNDEL